MTVTDWDRVRRRFTAALGEKAVVTDPAVIAAMARPWRDHWPSKPGLVLLPVDTAAVQAAVTICSEEHLPIVCQGGNTGVTGAGLARSNGADVLISLQRLNRIRDINLDDDMITVEAGCILASVKDLAQRSDRLFPLSLGSEGSCTIGGNIATNAGGINALRYGTMRNFVAGLEVVLPDGQLWNGLRSLRKDNTGYDLKHLYIGSEGTLGVITAAVLRLSALPRQSVSALVAVESPAMALTWLRRLTASFGDQLSACELIERICLESVLRQVSGTSDPLSNRYSWYVLAEVTSQNPSSDLEASMVDAFAVAHEADEVLDGVVASSGPQAQALWRLREGIPEANRHEGVSFKHDISVPVSRIPVFLDEAIRHLTLRFPGLRSFAFGHLGDGNIHYNCLQAVGEPAELWSSRQVDVNQIVHDLVMELGGSISAEHGIGQLRLGEMARLKDPVELGLMRRIKMALDPENRMNPGKMLSLAGLEVDSTIVGSGIGPH